MRALRPLTTNCGVPGGWKNNISRPHPPIISPSAKNSRSAPTTVLVPRHR